MEIQLVSPTAFFELFSFDRDKRFTGLIPQTVVCEEGKLQAWLFNSQKHSSHLVLKKNKENLSTLAFVKYLAYSIGTESTRECTSVGEVLDKLMLELKKEESDSRQPPNHTVLVFDSKTKSARYIRILDFVKSLSNRSFTEPQCPEGWSMFQEVILSRMRQHQSYYVEVYKLQGDLTFRFNYYKWMSRPDEEGNTVEPPYYQIWEHKDVIKVYEQNFTQKILTSVLQLVTFMETNFRLQIKRLVARYSFNSRQEPVLKGTSELRILAPRKFVDYGKLEGEQTLTIEEYMSLERSLRNLPEIVINAPPTEKRQSCPGGFCDAILKGKLKMENTGLPSHSISWSVIDSHNNPEIVKNLVDIGLIGLPSTTLEKREPKKVQSRAESTKICNKCYIIYKAIIKIEKAENAFESVELKKLLESSQEDSVKRRSRMATNYIEQNKTNVKDAQRTVFNSPARLPLISKTERVYAPSAESLPRTYRPVKIAPQQSTEKSPASKPPPSLVQSLVGEKFKSQLQLKQLLYKNFTLRHKSISVPKEKPSKEMKEKVSKSSIPAMSAQSQQEQIINKINQLIDQHASFPTKTQESDVPQAIPAKDLQLPPLQRDEKMTRKVESCLKDNPNIKIHTDWIQVEKSVSLAYCLLSPLDSRLCKSTLVIVHDVVGSFVEFLPSVRNLVTQETQILLMNYPGQAYTSFNRNKKLNGVWFSEMMDQLMCHLSTERLVNVEGDRLSFCGVGFGGYLLRYYLNMNYRYYPNWRSVLLVNSPAEISQDFEENCKKYLQQVTTEPRSKFKSYYWQFYHVAEEEAEACLESNEISDEGLLFLVRSASEQQNSLVELKSSKLKVVKKILGFAEETKNTKVTSRRRTTNSVIPSKYSPQYEGPEAPIHSVLSCKRFEDLLRNFLERNP